MKITNVMAASLDGKIAAHPLESDGVRRSYGFTNKDDQEFVRTQIMLADAIITGGDSMRASHGAWEQAGLGGKMPLWIVFSNSGLEPELKFWRQRAIPRWIVSRAPLEMHDPLVRNLVYGDQDPARYVVDELYRAAYHSVLLFGGGVINQLFYATNLVDELKLTLCPLIVGTSDAPNFVVPPLPQPAALRLISSQSVGSHVFLHYEVTTNLGTKSEAR